jgi:hypothetical protein
VLAVTDSTTVRATLGRLPATGAIALLRQLVGKLHSRPNRGADLVVWIRPLLSIHTAYPPPFLFCVFVCRVVSVLVSVLDSDVHHCSACRT